MDVDPQDFLKHLNNDDQYKGEIKKYWSSMAKLPRYDYSRFYSTYEDYKDVVIQGDVISDIDYAQLPKNIVKKAKCMIISSTCDIHLENTRKFPSKVLYTPLVLMSDFRARLEKAKNQDGTPKYGQDVLEQFFAQIRDQKIGQIFYLPKGGGLDEEAIIFFDTICSNSNNSIDRDNLESSRVVSLSAYATHIFISRLSMFFTRNTDETVSLRFSPSTEYAIS